MATELSMEHRMRIEHAIRSLNADYCYFLDHRDTDRLVGLFTKDAVYTHGSRTSNGRDEIQQLFAGRNASATRTARHLQSGLRIQVSGEATASGQSVCLTFAADLAPPIAPAAPTLIADFSDEYRLDGDGTWRINRRHIERIFVASLDDLPVGGSGQ